MAGHAPATTKWGSSWPRTHHNIKYIKIIIPGVLQGPGKKKTPVFLLRLTLDRARGIFRISRLE
jgi:hypothetical protein